MLQTTLYNLRENACAENEQSESKEGCTYADKPLLFKEIRRLIDCMPVSNNIKTTA